MKELFEQEKATGFQSIRSFDNILLHNKVAELLALLTSIVNGICVSKENRFRQPLHFLLNNFSQFSCQHLFHRLIWSFCSKNIFFKFSRFYYDFIKVIPKVKWMIIWPGFHYLKHFKLQVLWYFEGVALTRNSRSPSLWEFLA